MFKKVRISYFVNEKKWRISTVRKANFIKACSFEKILLRKLICGIELFGSTVNKRLSVVEIIFYCDDDNLTSKVFAMWSCFIVS